MPKPIGTTKIIAIAVLGILATLLAGLSAAACQSAAAPTTSPPGTAATTTAPAASATPVRPGATASVTPTASTLTGHDGWVYSVAFAPDGKTLASASGDATVKIWGVATGRVLRTLTGHEGEAYAVAFAPDGRTLATGSEDNTVNLWDPANGSLLRILEEHEDWVESVAFSPDGKTLAAAGEDVTLLPPPGVGGNWVIEMERVWDENPPNPPLQRGVGGIFVPHR